MQIPFYDNSESLDYDLNGKKCSRSGRQQRGDLKSVASISGLRMDGRHVVLEMSDVSTSFRYLSVKARIATELVLSSILLLFRVGIINALFSKLSSRIIHRNSSRDLELNETYR